MHGEVLWLGMKSGYIPLLPLFLNPLFLICKITYRVAEMKQNNVPWQALNNNMMFCLEKLVMFFCESCDHDIEETILLGGTCGKCGQS